MIGDVNVFLSGYDVLDYDEALDTSIENSIIDNKTGRITPLEAKFEKCQYSKYWAQLHQVKNDDANNNHLKEKKTIGCPSFVDESKEILQGEMELMIAEVSKRRHGYGHEEYAQRKG